MHVPVDAVRKVWRGVQFDSQLEADWAATLTAWGMEWKHHPGSLQLPDGRWWEPDFQVEGTDSDILLEVKGWHNERLDKAWIAAAMGFKVVVGREGWMPAGHSGEFAGAVWEPHEWVVVNVGSKLRFMQEQDALLGSVAPSYSADVAHARGLDGIRWFKAVGDDDYR